MSGAEDDATPSGNESFAQLVVIGASAGGVEALSRLVSTLPVGFPAPIVIAQHLDPRRASRLEEILAQRSALPVRTVTAHSRLEPGTIFVVPANRDVEITDHDVRVRAGESGRSQPSVDLLLSSAAEIFGEGLIAVVLTGMGSDGAAGARMVKERGGTVIIQNPDTASFPGMPLSLAPTVVDIVANLDAIGPLVNDLLIGAYTVPRPGEEKQLRSFLDQLRERSGIDFNSYKLPTITRRLQRRMAATGSEKLTDYIRYLQREPSEYQRLVNSFLIKVTEFFRDPELYAYLRDQILPTLAEEVKKRHELRIWSAGCATGEEAYSLAILLWEILGQELEHTSVRIFATDLDADAVAFARQGVYPASAVSSIPPDLLERYFNRINSAYEVKKHVRGLVVFGQHDLAQRAPFPRIDLILFRNVLIYFTPDMQKRALQLFAFSLRDAGYLVLGKAETVSPLAELFALEQARLKVYHRVGDRVLIPAARIRDAPPMLPNRSPIAARGGALGDRRPGQAPHEVNRPRGGERFEGLLQRLPLGIVVVDRAYDIQFINNAARRLLGIHSSAIGHDFIHLVQYVPLLPIRNAIDAAFRGEAPTAVYEVASPPAAPGEQRYLAISCSAERWGAEAGPADAVMVQVSDATAVERERREHEQRARQQEEAIAARSAQIRQLAEANGQLLDANQELTAANAELRTANEELLVANEEAQAATEEVETLNEELQATNEELETLNEELQATVEELNTTNDDLHARSIELQELAVSLEAERRAADMERNRLAAILVSMGDAVLVVDTQGQTTLTNAAYETMFGHPEVDFVPQDQEGQPLPADETPRARAARGEAFSMEFTMTSADGTRCYFEAVGQPIGQEGGVVVIRDITDRSLRRLQDEFLATASHELRTPLTVLTGYLAMLNRRPLSDERAATYVRLAMEQAQRIDTLMRQLLDVTRLQGGKLVLAREPVDLVALLQHVVE